MKKTTVIIFITLVILTMACTRKPVGELKINGYAPNEELVDSNGTVFISPPNRRIYKPNKYFYVIEQNRESQTAESFKIFSCTNAKLTYDTYESVFPVRFIDSIIFAKQGDFVYLYDQYLNKVAWFKASYASSYNSKYAILGRKIDDLTSSVFLVNPQGKISNDLGFTDLIAFDIENILLRTSISCGFYYRINESDLSNDEFKNILNNSIIITLSNGKYGLISSNGDIIIPNVYNFLWVYSNDILIACENSRWVLLRSDGSTITKGYYDEIGHYIVGYNTRMNPISLSLDTIRSYSFTNYLMNASYSPNLSKGEMSEYINSYRNQKGLSEGLIRVKKDGKWGYIDTLGREVIPLKYSSARNFSNGVAEVTLKGRTLRIDKRGNVVK